jgi:ABC-type microcin C transport system duplicated ATPase subunit YejF
MLRLVEDAHYQGSIRFEGEDLLQVSDREMRRIRGSEIAMIFQEPMTALNPLYTIGNQIVETLALHEGWTAGLPAIARLRCSSAPASPTRPTVSIASRTSCRVASVSAR